MKLSQLLKISSRNILRNRRRTLLTLMILALGGTGIIVVDGFLGGIIDGFGEVYIHSNTGHMQVSKRGYFEKGSTSPFDYLLSDVSRIEKEIKSNPHVQYTVPRLKFSGMLSSDKASSAALIIGVDPVRESRMTRHKYETVKDEATSLIAGKDLNPSDPNGVLLGAGLMKALELKLGDPVVLITTRESGAIEGAEYHVRGVFDTVIKEVGDRLMKVNLSHAQELLGVPNQLHRLLVILDETAQTNLAKEALDTRFRNLGLNLETITWSQQALLYRKSKDFFDRIRNMVGLIIAVIFFFSIANTVNMALFERMREFGTMMALGNSRWIISGNILLESLLMALIGATLGIILGAMVAALISQIGIEMPPLPFLAGSSSFIVAILITPGVLLKTYIITFVATLLSSIGPAYRASHFRIIAALGYV